jgi:thiol-disulfide isomerase/thioredoxin
VTSAGPLDSPGAARAAGASAGGASASDKSAVGESAGEASRWLVACLCAAWCRTCDEYRPLFAAVAREHPEMRFAWIDIEDESDALGALAMEVEDFPTLLIAEGASLRFYGPLLPHATTLARTLEAARRSVLTPGVAALEASLLARLHGVGETIG